jgi:MFS family permease
MVVHAPPVLEPTLRRALPLGFLATIFIINVAGYMNFASVFVAMVQIGKALDAPVSMALQLPTALYVATACAAPMTPFLLRRLGPRWLLLFSILGLCATTILASLCQTFWQLIVVLFVHGLFYAPLSPATQAAVKETLDRRDLGIGMAVWGAGNYAAGLIGPLLAGIMITAFGWRSLFLIPLPFALLVIPLVWMVIRSDPDRRARADAVSMIYAPILMLLLVATASLGPSLSWFSSPLIIATTVGFALALPLTVWSYRRNSSPAYHLGCIMNRDTGLSLAIVLIFNMISTGLFQVEYLGLDSKMTPEIIGLRSSIAAATLLLGCTIAGWLCKIERYGTTLYLGLLLTFVAKAGFMLYSSDSDAVVAIWPVIFSGLSFGMVTCVCATLAYRTISENHAPHVATCFILATYLGASLGAGILNEVMIFIDGVFIGEGMTAANATLQAFKGEFIVEFAISALLLWPAWLLLRNGRTSDAMSQG